MELHNPWDERSTWTYDAAGQTVTMTAANGTRAESTYNGAGQLTDLSNKQSGGTVISSFAYRLDGVGNRLGWTEANGDVVTLGYDATYQLIHEQRGGAHDYNGTYTYDGVGNRTHLQDKNTPTTYTYDAGNQLTVEQRPTVALTYSYDRKGNLTVIENPTTDLTTYTWDGENRLAAIAFGANRHTMTYDGDGLRRSFALAGDETRFVWDNQDVLLETNAGGVTQTAYTQTPALFGEIVAQRKAGASRFYHFDALGSTMELTDGAEATTDTLRYRAFGESLVSTGATAPRYRWVGKLGYYWQSDNGIALDYVRARWYRPRIGRWVSQDPLGVLGSGYPRRLADLLRAAMALAVATVAGPLLYVANNPARWPDSTGLDQLIGLPEQGLGPGGPGLWAPELPPPAAYPPGALPPWASWPELPNPWDTTIIGELLQGSTWGEGFELGITSGYYDCYEHCMLGEPSMPGLPEIHYPACSPQANDPVTAGLTMLSTLSTLYFYFAEQAARASAANDRELFREAQAAADTAAELYWLGRRGAWGAVARGLARIGIGVTAVVVTVSSVNCMIRCGDALQHGSVTGSP